MERPSGPRPSASTAPPLLVVQLPLGHVRPPAPGRLRRRSARGTTRLTSSQASRNRPRPRFTGIHAQAERQILDGGIHGRHEQERGGDQHAQLHEQAAEWDPQLQRGDGDRPGHAARAPRAARSASGAASGNLGDAPRGGSPRRLGGSEASVRRPATGGATPGCPVTGLASADCPVPPGDRGPPCRAPSARRPSVEPTARRRVRPPPVVKAAPRVGAASRVGCQRRVPSRSRHRLAAERRGPDVTTAPTLRPIDGAA